MSIIVFQNKLKELAKKVRECIEELKKYHKEGVVISNKDIIELSEDTKPIILRSFSTDFITVVENFKILIFELLKVKVSPSKDSFQTGVDNKIDIERSKEIMQRALAEKIIPIKEKDTWKELIDMRNDICHGRYNEDKINLFYNKLEDTIKLFNKRLREIIKKYKI